MSADPVTEDEGAFLALLVRVHPATGYQIAKVYAESPVSSFGTSKGKIYPLIRRLGERGLLRKRKAKAGPPGTEILTVTAKGRIAVQRWTKQIKPAFLLPGDPLRTRVQSFDLLSRDEQVEGS